MQQLDWVSWNVIAVRLAGDGLVALGEDFM
jgi:hypothetical protein